MSLMTAIDEVRRYLPETAGLPEPTRIRAPAAAQEPQVAFRVLEGFGAEIFWGQGACPAPSL